MMTIKRTYWLHISSIARILNSIGEKLLRILWKIKWSDINENNPITVMLSPLKDLTSWSVVSGQWSQMMI